MNKNTALAGAFLMAVLALAPAVDAQVVSASAGANWSCTSTLTYCEFQAVGFHSSTVPLVATGTLSLNGAFQGACQILALSCSTAGPVIYVPHGFRYTVVATTSSPAGVAVDTEMGVVP